MSGQERGTTAGRALPAKRINLLVEVASFDKGGLEKVVLDSALRFDPTRFSVIIVSIGRTGWLAEVARRNGIRVYRLPVLGKASSLRRIIKRHDVNLSVSHYSYFGYHLYKQAGIPNVTFIHNVYAHLTSALLQQFRDADSLVDRYIAVSSTAARYAVCKLGIAPGKITVIPNGLILEEHEQRQRSAPPLARSQFGLAESDYVFLNVASYNLHKGHYLMADAMRYVLEVRDDVRILCIGNTIVPAHFKEYRQYLAAKGLDRHILLPGFSPQVESFYPISDAFLLPSFIEGWSIAMNEAMFYGKPLIMTATGGAPDVIKDNDIGIQVDNEYGDVLNLDARLLDQLAYERREFETAPQLAAAMLEFVNNREHWRERGRRGREKVISDFNLEDIVRRYEQLFCDVLQVVAGE